jgi:hypothetical protein
LTTRSIYFENSNRQFSSHDFFFTGAFIEIILPNWRRMIAVTQVIWNLHTDREMLKT